MKRYIVGLAVASLLVSPLLFSPKKSNALLVVSFDTAATFSTSTVQELNESLTLTTSANRFLFSCISAEGTSNDIIDGPPTYGGQAMTRIGDYSVASPAAHVYLYALRNPASGTNNLSVTTTENADLSVASADYFGVANNQPEASTTTLQPSASSSSAFAMRVTTKSALASVVGCAKWGAGTISAGSNTTFRANSSQDRIAIIESSFNSILLPAPITVNTSGSQVSDTGGFLLSLAPNLL